MYETEIFTKFREYLKETHSFFSDITGIFIFILIMIKFPYKVYLYFNKLTIIWGKFDSPTPLRTDYYIILKSKKQENTVKLELHPLSMLPTDFKVTVTAWEQLLGYELMEDLVISQTDFKNHKEILYNLPGQRCYRLTVESIGGMMGTNASQNLKALTLSLPEVEGHIKYKPQKAPYEKLSLKKIFTFSR